jgi:hypothetical protein
VCEAYGWTQADSLPFVANPREVHEGFTVEKVELGKIFQQTLRLSLSNYHYTNIQY